jgi:hypothetical protein
VESLAVCRYLFCSARLWHLINFSFLKICVA